MPVAKARRAPTTFGSADPTKSPDLTSIGMENQCWKAAAHLSYGVEIGGRDRATMPYTVKNRQSGLCTTPTTRRTGASPSSGLKSCFGPRMDGRQHTVWPELLSVSETD